MFPRLYKILGILLPSVLTSLLPRVDPCPCFPIFHFISPLSSLVKFPTSVVPLYFSQFLPFPSIDTKKTDKKKKEVTEMILIDTLLYF